MPVGTGSINRAARSSKKAAEVKKEEVNAVAAEEVTAEVKVVPEKAATVQKKATSKKPAAKKPAVKKAAPKKAAVKETAAEEVVVEKAPELRVYGNETVFVVGNECCHQASQLHGGGFNGQRIGRKRVLLELIYVFLKAVRDG